MINSDNPKQLTVGQLMDALGYYDRADLVKFYDCNHSKEFDIVYVEKSSTDKVAYLRNIPFDPKGNELPNEILEEIGISVKVVREGVNFAETITIYEEISEKTNAK
jgi:hypothetical protein